MSFVLIDCPEHLSHKVKLYCQGEKYEGIWECEESGSSDSCPHYDTGVKTIEVDTMRNGEHDTYDARVYYCTLCGCDVEGDPDEDASFDCD
jgi:hypothetical protein